MAVSRRPSTGEIGQHFAKRVRSEAVARRLWVRPQRGTVELWLVTAPADPETVHRLHKAGTALEEQYPEAALRLHVLNARNYPHVDPATLIPEGAEEVPLRPE
jgi:hypothetical protein